MITGQKVVLRDKKLSDARNDYKWKKDPELAQLDAAPQLTSSFAQFLLNYSADLHFARSTSRQFAIETTDGKHIGNCGFYDINPVRGEAELGIMIGDRDYWDKGYGADAVNTLVDYIFRETELNRIYLKREVWLRPVCKMGEGRVQLCADGDKPQPVAKAAGKGLIFLLLPVRQADRSCTG